MTQSETCTVCQTLLGREAWAAWDGVCCDCQETLLVLDEVEEATQW